MNKQTDTWSRFFSFEAVAAAAGQPLEQDQNNDNTEGNDA